MRIIEEIPLRKAEFILFSGTFFLRAVYSLYYWFVADPPVTNAYYEIACQILDQGKIFYDTSHPYYESVGPVMPLINALTMLVAGRNYLGLYIVTALASALTTLYTYKLARLLVDRSTALFAGLWSAFYLFYFFYTPTPGKDIWMAFFMVLLLYRLIRMVALRDYSWPQFIIFSALFTVSFHLDERFFLFSPFIFLLILKEETCSFRFLRLTRSLAFAGIVILLTVPWTIRNYNKHGKIVIISTRTERFTDRFFGYEPRPHIMDPFNDTYGAFYIHDYQVDSVITGLKTVTDGGRTISASQVAAMKKGILPAPLTGMQAAWSRLVTMFEPIQIRGRYERTGYFWYEKSLRHNIATFVFYGTLFLFSFPGFGFLVKKNRKVALILISVIIIYALVHALAIPYTNWRYRLPLDSLFIIAGCTGITGLYHRYLNGNKQKPADAI